MRAVPVEGFARLVIAVWPSWQGRPRANRTTPPHGSRFRSLHVSDEPHVGQPGGLRRHAAHDAPTQGAGRRLAARPRVPRRRVRKTHTELPDPRPCLQSRSERNTRSRTRLASRLIRGTYRSASVLSYVGRQPRCSPCQLTLARAGTTADRRRPATERMSGASQSR